MLRLGLALVLLQGSLFTAFATEVATSTSEPDQGKNLTGVTETPLYRFGNISGESCILLETDAYVAIKWEGDNNETTEIDMFLEPNKVHTTGSCTEDEASLSLTWKSFHLRWNFAKTRDWAKWFAKQVELQYDKSGLDNKIVNGTTGMATVSTRGSSEVMLFSAPMGEAYHCPSEYELELTGDGTDKATLRLRNFRVQPFLTTATFGQSYCPTHSTGAAFMITTDSSDSSTSGITKTDTSSPSGSSVHINTVSISPMKSTSAPIPPSPSTAPSKHMYHTSSQPRITSHFPPGTSTMSSRSEKMLESSRLPGVSQERVFVPSTAVPPTTPLLSAVGLTTYGPPFGTSMPPYAYQKAFPNVIKMPFYPPKKVFFSGVKMDNNDALSAMLWSWYTSGFYTGYYQALQQSKKAY